ncbi:MAG TPA: serine/threonine-protein kinase [Nonomuraea sp.]|nr:serine/threonine-protein kinase [Nonomuraea sp.]
MRVGNRYHLIEPIGEGGMGVVWRAHDELLDRTVAVKEVRYSGVGDARRAELNRRTIREARAAGRLDHPSVIVVHDVVEEDGRPWIVMQLVRSRSLAQTIKERGPLPVGLVATIGARVLDALRAAHATGVLHRDVKPENVLLAHDGRVVLTDFGIASLEAEAGLTATGGLVGTPAYMPPERLNGDPARPESDLWSLGATLYAAVEGRPPFQRDSWAATVAAVLRDAPEPPSRAGVLAPVIMGLLRHDPSARLPADAAAGLLHEAATTADLPGPRAGAGPGPWAGAGVHPMARTSHHGGHPGDASHQTGHSHPGNPAHWSGATGDPAHLAAPEAGRASVTVPEGRRRGKAMWAGLAVAAAVVVGAGGVLVYREWTSRTSVTDPTETAAGQTGASAVQTGTPPQDPSPTQDASPSGDTPTDPAPTGPPPSPTADLAVPDGWRRYPNAAGRFSIAVPQGWQARKNPARDSVSFQGPGLPGTMIVEWTVPDFLWKDPVRRWTALEKEILAKGAFEGYTRLGIRPTTYRGRPAADWEFTRTRGGRLIHVVNRGFRTADGRPFALYWETTDSRWGQDRHYFETFTKTFRPW